MRARGRVSWGEGGHEAREMAAEGLLWFPHALVDDSVNSKSNPLPGPMLGAETDGEQDRHL